MRNNEKETFITKDIALSAMKEYATPFYIYDEDGIRKNAREVKKAFAWNKGFKEYFAVKATPNPYILKILQDEGCGVDCSSYTELMLSERCGFGNSEIMFSSNVTPEEDYVYANKLGAYINLDDLSDVETIKKLNIIPENIFCRFNPGGIFELGNGIMDNPGDSKFGMTKEQMIKSFKKLKELGVKHFGIHAFLASNTVTNEYYPKLAGILFELAVSLKKECDVDIKFINLSGGVGVNYKPGEVKNNIMEIGEGVRKKFDEILVKNGMEDVSIFTEMGRFMLAPFGNLVTKVIHEKKIYKDYIGVDASAVNLIRPAMYDAYHYITVLGKENEECTNKYNVTGGLCENNDMFAKDRMLPKIEIGDILAIHDAGAHSFSMGYNYNGKQKSSELLLKEDGSIQMIRRAETPEDYFATFDFSDEFRFDKKVMIKN